MEIIALSGTSGIFGVSCFLLFTAVKYPAAGFHQLDVVMFQPCGNFEDLSWLVGYLAGFMSVLKGVAWSAQQHPS